MHPRFRKNKDNSSPTLISIWKKKLFVKNIKFKSIFNIKIALILLNALDIEYFSREKSLNHRLLFVR